MREERMPPSFKGASNKKYPPTKRHMLDKLASMKKDFDFWEKQIQGKGIISRLGLPIIKGLKRKIEKLEAEIENLK